jgi:uncharacterized protein (DUF302 family)
MDQSPTQLGFHVHLDTEFETAIARVTAALKSEGFGVLTEIDVRETLKQKLGVDFRQYKILGACNPPLAHQALTLAPEVGLLLPCNVVVSEAAPGDIDVSLVDPLVMLGVAGHTQLEPVAQAARARLERVAEALKE